MAVGLLNGGLHAAVWDSHFPTDAEMHLWRASCVSIVTISVLAYVIGARKDFQRYLLLWGYRVSTRGNSNNARHVGFQFKRTWFEFVESAGQVKGILRWEKVLPTWGKHFMAGLYLTLGITLLSFTSFLAVEAFISARSLPKGAYSTVDWENYFPHI